jgi:hypothetical protein
LLAEFDYGPIAVVVVVCILMIGFRTIHAQRSFLKEREMSFSPFLVYFLFVTYLIDITVPH